MITSRYSIIPFWFQFCFRFGYYLYFFIFLYIFYSYIYSFEVFYFALNSCYHYDHYLLRKLIFQK
jgi:hypothetical protein